MDNSASATAPARDAGGRFLPGQSGNPAGKRPGTRNRATLIRQAFAEGEEMVVARAVIDKAKDGDAVSARFLLGLLCPRPRDRAITLDLPDGMCAGDTVAAFNTTLLAMAAGEITPDEALTITRMFDGRLQALRAWELERQMIWVRREHIPGDELFAPPDEEVEADEAEEVVADAQTEPSPPGRGQGEGSRNSPTGSSRCETGSPHPNPLPEGEGIMGKAADEEVEADEAADEGEAEGVEPSPACGRGQGEGSQRARDRDDSASSGSPHPNPLPGGEGTEAPIERSPPARHYGAAGR